MSSKAGKTRIKHRKAAMQGKINALSMTVLLQVQ